MSELQIITTTLLLLGLSLTGVGFVLEARRWVRMPTVKVQPATLKEWHGGLSEDYEYKIFHSWRVSSTDIATPQNFNNDGDFERWLENSWVIHAVGPPAIGPWGTGNIYRYNVILRKPRPVAQEGQL